MSKPSSPKSPKTPKDAKPGGEKKALDLGELMQRLDEAFAHQEMQTEEIAEKKARIEDLEAQLAQKVVDIEELHAHYKVEMRKVIEEERLKRRQLQVRFGARVEELHNRLESVKSFIQQQDEVEARMEAAEKEAEETPAQMADLPPGFEHKHVEKCLAYKEEIDKKLEEFMLKVKEDIGNRVGDRVREVLAQKYVARDRHAWDVQNEILLSEIYTHTSSTTGLQEEADRLKAENRKLRGEIDLKAQDEELHIKRNRHQRHVIRHNDSKIQNLEKSLQQVIRQFSEERRILQEEHAFIVAEVKADNMKLKSIVLQKAQELKKFRHLAEIVIRQRGEVELFLLDSIQYVKNQIYSQRKIQSYQTADNADTLSGNGSNVNCASLNSSSTMVSALPPIHKAPASWPGAGPWPRVKNPEIREQNHSKGGIHDVNSLAGVYNMTEAQAEAQINFLDSSHDPFTVPVILPVIDISDLSWEDREKVLRYLFRKINTAWINQLQAEHAKRSQAMQAEQEKYQGYASTEAARTIVSTSA